MRKEKILTIIIPSYNSENYLEKCINSLENLGDASLLALLEIIIVNDGSKDSTLEIARSLERRFSNIIVINKINGGHGSCINCGISIANGKYTKVIDSDDWVEPNAFVSFLKQISNVDCDIVSHNHYRYYENIDKLEKCDIGKIAYNKILYKKDLNTSFRIGLTNACFKTDILKQIPQIDEHCFYVDLEYILFPIPFCNSFICFEDNVYVYRLGTSTQSVSNANMIKNISHMEKVIFRLTSFYKTIVYKDNKGMLNYIINIISGLIKDCCRTANFSKDKHLFVKIKKMLRQIKQESIDIFKYSLKSYFDVKICFFLTFGIANILSKIRLVMLASKAK